MSRIVWLASYPKSGNTWFRIFLTNLLRGGDQPADINRLDGGPIASAREPFDAAVGFDSGELTFDEVDALRPDVYAYQAEQAAEPIYCKVHDAYIILPDGRPMFPASATQCALYFVRNPLDVCVSFAHHSGRSGEKEDYDRLIKSMANPKNSLAKMRFTEPDQLRQRVLSWSGHVLSWADAKEIPVHVMRYEDMREKPEETFGAAARFAGLPDDPERIRRAIAFSSFSELREQEEKKGFREKLRPEVKAFFRKGTSGSWREELSPDQARQIIEDHAGVMRRYGYLDDKGEPVY